MARTYTELMQFQTFEERFQYLKLDGKVGTATFGFDRYLNQRFYHSQEWRHVRDWVISRDSGCDLAIPDRAIYGRIQIHHMNPISADDIKLSTKYLLEPEFLICVSLDTHNAIHFGNENNLFPEPVERSPNDTCPWKMKKVEIDGPRQHTKFYQEDARS